MTHSLCNSRGPSLRKKSFLYLQFSAQHVAIIGILFKLSHNFHWVIYGVHLDGGNFLYFQQTIFSMGWKTLILSLCLVTVTIFFRRFCLTLLLTHHQSSHSFIPSFIRTPFPGQMCDRYCVKCWRHTDKKTWYLFSRNLQFSVCGEVRFGYGRHHFGIGYKITTGDVGNVSRDS